MRNILIFNFSLSSAPLPCQEIFSHRNKKGAVKLTPRYYFRHHLLSLFQVATFKKLINQRFAPVNNAVFCMPAFFGFRVEPDDFSPVA